MIACHRQGRGDHHDIDVPAVQKLAKGIVIAGVQAGLCLAKLRHDLCGAVQHQLLGIAYRRDAGAFDIAEVAHEPDAALAYANQSYPYRVKTWRHQVHDRAAAHRPGTLQLAAGLHGARAQSSQRTDCQGGLQKLAPSSIAHSLLSSFIQTKYNETHKAYAIYHYQLLPSAQARLSSCKPVPIRIPEYQSADSTPYCVERRRQGCRSGAPRMGSCVSTQ